MWLREFLVRRFAFPVSVALGADPTDISTQRLGIYIPDKDRNGNNIRALRVWIDAALRVLSNLSDGATEQHGLHGTWVHKDDGLIIDEETVFVYTFINPDKFDANFGALRAYAHRFGRETLQGTVMIEFDGVVYRIKSFDLPMNEMRD